MQAFCRYTPLRHVSKQHGRNHIFYRFFFKHSKTCFVAAKGLGCTCSRLVRKTASWRLTPLARYGRGRSNSYLVTLLPKSKWQTARHIQTCAVTNYSAFRKYSDPLNYSTFCCYSLNSKLIQLTFSPTHLHTIPRNDKVKKCFKNMFANLLKIKYWNLTYCTLPSGMSHPIFHICLCYCLK